MSLWRDLFGDDRSVEIEIGPGRGDVLLAFAAAAPERGFFGIERSPGLAETIERRARARGLQNLHAVGAEARCIVATVVPASSVATYHIYFPDPWPKRRHHPRRLFDDPRFAITLAQTLVPGGCVHVASDLAPTHAAMEHALAAAGFRRLATPPPSRPTTRFERKYGQAGTHASSWRRST